MSVLDLLRPEVRAFHAYSSARSESGAAAVMLNANESPWAPMGHAGWNRYPDPQPEALRTLMADHYGVPVDQVLMGRGSDEGIDLLMRGFCRPGKDAIAICPPTFGMYAVSANLQGARVVDVPLEPDTFAIDMDALMDACSADVKLVFLCSPNNPTGNVVPLNVVESVAARLAERAMVVVDEAYIEFAEAPSAAKLLDRHANLVVLRTLSKAWSLAGARVGALLAQPHVVSALRAIMTPYPLPLPSVAVAVETLEPEGSRAMRDHVATIINERRVMRARLAVLPMVKEVLPSHANFLAVRWRDAHAVLAHLADSGIVVRDITRYPHLDDALRISIGTDDENRRLLEALERFSDREQGT